MSFKKIAGIVCFLSLLSGTPVFAANSNNDAASMIAAVGKDAAYGYTQPLVTDLGEGMNSGWYNCAKPLSLFNKLPFGLAIGMVNVPIIVVDNTMKSFNFKGELPVKFLLDSTFKKIGFSIDSVNSILNNPNTKAILASHHIDTANLGIESSILFDAGKQPTIFGADSAQQVTIDSLFSPNHTPSKTLTTIRTYNQLVIIQDSTIAFMHGNTYNRSMSANDTINLSEQIPLPFRGLEKIIDKLGGLMFSIPSVTVEAGVSKIPVIGNLTVGLRLIPETDLHSLSSDIPFGKVSLFGYKLQYEYLHLIPGAGLLPIKSSVMFAHSSMSLHSDTVNIDQSAWLAQIIASADAHFGIFGAGIYGGIGYGGSNMDLNLKMSKVDTRLPDINLNIPGKNSFRCTIGPRISFFNFEIYGDANFGSVTSYNLGVTVLGFTGRGL